MSRREIIKTDNVSVRIMALARDEATEWHFHTQVTDFFVCLQGAIQVETRDPSGVTLLQPGEQAEVGPMAVHRVLNVSADRAEYLLVQGVGGYDFCRV